MSDLPVGAAPAAPVWHPIALLRFSPGLSDPGTGRLHAKLLALGDQAEYQIKLIPVDIDLPPLPEGLKGRDYFLAKKQRLQDLALAQQQQQAEQQRLLQALTAAYPQAVVDEAATATKVYLLLPRSQQEALATDLGEWQAASPQWQIHMSEALPPYHFV